MRRFLHWPLADQIVLIALILSVICILYNRLVDRPQDHIAASNVGFFRMHPLRSSAVLGLGIILLEGVIVFGLLGPTSRMYWLAKIEVGCAMMAVTGGYFYSIYLMRYSFNAEEFVATDLLLRRTQRFLWSSLGELGVRGGRPYFKVAGKRFPLVPFGRSGGKQVAAVIDSKILRLTAPLVPIYDSKQLQQFNGKSMRVDLMQIDEACHARVVRSDTGSINVTGENEVSITFNDGNTLRAAGNLRSFKCIGSKPEWVVSWYLERTASIA